MDIEKLHADCLLSPLTDGEFKQAVAQLSERFTTRRFALAGYGDDPRLVSAYAAFYLPTNMKKLGFVLNCLPSFPLEISQPLEVIDVGCGPGTYSFALYEFLESIDRGESAGPNPMVFHFVDSASTMLSQARRIQQTLYPQMNAQYHTAVPPVRSDVKRLVLFGNVINEVGGEAIEPLLKQAGGDMIVCIEPGTRESFQLMANVRTRMLAHHYEVQYPCADGSPCPVDSNSTQWCHQVLKASLEPAIGRLGQLAGLDRTVMPFIGHVYVKKTTGDSPVASPPQNALLYRLKTHSKHAYFWELCVHTPDGLKIQAVELPKKPLSRTEQKAFERISAGARIGFRVEKVLGNGAWRIAGVEVQQ